MAVRERSGFRTGPPGQMLGAGQFIYDEDAAGIDRADFARECAARWPRLGHSPATISRVLARWRAERLARTIVGFRDDFNNSIKSESLFTIFLGLAP